MKKTILSMLLTVMTVGVSAQKLYIDKQDDGVRVCQTYAKMACKKIGLIGGRVIFAGLICEAYEKGDTIYKISILHQCIENWKENRPTIDVGRKLLLKSSDGEIFELSNCLEVGVSDYTFDVTSSGTTYTVNPIYPIGKKELMHIINHEITSARIETNLSLFDFNKTSFSKVLKKELQEIDKALQQKKGLYDGF